MILDAEQCQQLERAWRNFDAVVSRLPLSDISALLAFHTRNLLEQLDNPPVDTEYVKVVTKRVNELVQSSPMLLDIDDMLKLVNITLEQLKSHQPVTKD